MHRTAANPADQMQLEKLNARFRNKSIQLDFVQNLVGQEYVGFIAERTLFDLNNVRPKSYAIKSAEIILLDNGAAAHFCTTKDRKKIVLVARTEHKVFTLSSKDGVLTFNQPNGISANGLLVNLLYGFHTKDIIAPEGKRQVAVDANASIHRIYRPNLDFMFNIPNVITPGPG